MTPHHFDAPSELNCIRQYRNLRKRKAYQHSRLQKFRVELIGMRKAGGSFRELSLWLRKIKRIKVTHTTVMRYLAQLPELKDSHGEESHAKLP
jgi:hypothetical protein